MRSLPLLQVMTASLLLGMSCRGDSSTPDGNIPVHLEVAANGLSFPLDVTAPPGDSRLFIAEKGGTIRIVKNGSLLAAPFLDISSLVSNGSEQGLLGLAFHPQYASNGFFFVDYTDQSGDTQVARYKVSGNPDLADIASAAPVIHIDQPYSNHNGGAVVFGPDGYLYIALGDGGSGGDPQGHGQDRTDLLGSLLRLDINASPYSIPPSNPYAGSTTLRQELWNYGLRNPWRFSFDRSNGYLYIGDVGQNNREEIDVTPAPSSGGENYGWNTMEGTSCYPGGTCNRTGLVLPVLDYGHGDGCSVTGGFVYRGSAIPALQGTYFYSDYCEGWVRSFRYQNGEATDKRAWPDLSGKGNVSSFGQDAAGELYLVVSSGTVYRLVP
ncbi:MAG: PQQ-dependent sugar dehydrogenase [Gemmatimonadota bacterium]